MKTIIEKSLICILGAFVIMASAICALSQGPLPPKVAAPTRVLPPGVPRPAPLAVFGDTVERSIAVDPGVNLTLCVVQGNLKINGWSRDEVRIFVKDGSQVGFKVLQKGRNDGKPVWISAIGYDPKKLNKGFPDCVWGEDVEIDVPLKATVNIKGQETRTSVDTVRKVSVKSIGGDISVRNISGGVTATTFQGDVTVENAQGSMMLDSTTGNILVFNAGPDEIGDAFKAKTTSGTIQLQQLEHRLIEVNSISGAIVFNGEILNGGTYSLSTSNGSIRMSLPPDSSGKVSATYGSGTFNCDLPVKLLTENIEEGPVKTAVWTLGKGGEATVKLSTNNGSISIKKQ